MQVVVNGKETSTEAASLSDLVREHVTPGAKVATALNGQFVPAAERAQRQLKSGDRIEIVSPRQGG